MLPAVAAMTRTTDPFPPEQHGETPPHSADHVDAIMERLRTHQTRAPRHVVVGELGQGSMGVVLEVHDCDLRRPLALKRLHPDREADSDPARQRHFVARFLLEAQVTGQLGHPGIPPVHELALDADGRPFFTMPLIRGASLSDVIADARAGVHGWTAQRALLVLVKVCEAMAFAHAKRVIHRDLKPDNVRIGRFGEVYVMDWGLARVLGRDTPDIVRWAPRPLSSVQTDRRDGGAPNEVLMTLDGDVLGTPYYMAPEQARGELDRVDARADVYAVGAMLYLLLAGRPPYAPTTGRLSARTVVGLVVHGPPPTVASLAPDADPDLIAVCERAMARDREQRYAGMNELAQDLEAWLGRRPVRASAPSLGRTLRLFVQRHRAASLTAAAALAILSVAGTGFVLRLSQESVAKELARQASERRGDAMAAASLAEREKRLWPAVPTRVEALGAWLDDAEDLLRRERGYRDALARASGADRAELEAILQSTERVASLRPSIERRIALARSIGKLSLDDQAAAWEQVIADLSGDARFAGVRLAPQLGLVPLWKNESSGLWEFWHVASGVRPVAGAPRAEDGIVLVLIPPGVLAHGVPQESSDVKGMRWQPDASEVREPIAAAFIAKHELTQDQWERAMGTRPSRWQPGVTAGAPACPTCPVESVNWIDAAGCMERLGLRLPSELEWEYACRAGSEYRDFVHGPDAGAVEGHENVRDMTAGSVPGSPAAAWSDGYSQLAPVGTFLPNAFGLHDMLGNVSEWCADEFLPVPRSERPVDRAPVEIRVFRGGSWYGSILTNAGCAWFRQWDKHASLNHARGLRACRSVDP